MGALQKTQFTAEELTQIDQFAVESGIDLWRKPSTDQAI